MKTAGREGMRKKPACVLSRDARLTELRQLEDRESLRPWLQKYGCFEKKNAWSSAGIVHVDNLKELAKRLRLHKSIPNFFRDYTTEDSLVAVLKRYVRNNAAFLSEVPSVAKGRRVENSQTDANGAATVSRGDVPNAYIMSMDSTFSSMERRVATNSGDARCTARDDSDVLAPEIACATVGDSRYSQRTCGVSVGRYGGVLSSNVVQAGGTGGSSTAQVLKGAAFATSGTMPSSAGGRCPRGITGVPRRPMQPKRSAKANILLSPNAGGLKLFGHSGANNMDGIIHMSRMGLSPENVDSLQIIFRQGQQRSRVSFGVHRSQTEMSAQGAGVDVPSDGDISGAGDQRSQISIPSFGGRQGAQTASRGKGIGSTSKQRTSNGGLAHQRKKNKDRDGSFSYEDNRSANWGDSGGDYGARLIDGIEDDDCSQAIKIKAAQALYRMSLRHGGEMKMVRDGVVIALKKLVEIKSVLAHRLVSGCLVNLTTNRNVAWELLRTDGHQVLAFLVNGVKAPDSIVLENVATALCRCSYEARNHHRLVAEFNTAQALCYIMQRQDINLKITSAKGILNICGLSSTIPALAAKLDVWMLTMCSALEDLARNEMEAAQTFVCRAIQRLTSISICLTRIPESGVVDLFLPLVKLNQKRPENLARLTAAVVNLTDLQSAHAQFVKQKDTVTVLRLLSAHPRLVESCCLAAAKLSTTRDLEIHLAPLATTLVESCVQNENTVDCIAYFLQNVTRAHPMTESVVTTWLAVEGDLASLEGRLACLYAIGNLARHQEDIDKPLLRAGLIGTLHAILDEPTAPATDEVQGGTAADPSTSSTVSIATSSSSRASTRVGKDGPSSPIPSMPSSLMRGTSGSIVASAAKIKNAIATSQRRKKHRDDLMQSGKVMMNHTLMAITKLCFSLTVRAKNGPRLVQQDLPGLCAKISKLTKDENIHFMAAACIYSLSRSPNLRSAIADSGAVEFTLEALAQSERESEYVLAQLALIAQMAGEPKVCRRLVSTASVDLLEKLSLGWFQGKDREPSTFDVFNTTKDQNNCRDSNYDESHSHGGEKRSAEACSKSGGGLDEAYIPQRPGGSKPMKLEAPPGKRVKVTSPFLSAVRYSVVTIAEHLGLMLDDGGAFGRKLSPSDVSYIVEKLVRIVCLVVLTSGPDEALMGCCARVIAEWSIDPKFSREMRVKSYTGLSLALLMRSVAPATMARASIALANVAATNKDHKQHIAGSPHAGCRPATTDKASVSTGEETSDERPTNPTSDSRDKGRHDPKGGPRSSAVCDYDYWIESTDLLREIVTRGLLRSTPEVKGNVIMAFNNLMCSEKTRAALVTGNYMPLFFDLVRGNTSEIRELSSEILCNLTCEPRFHTTLLEAGIVYALFELLGPLQHGVQETPATVTQSAQVNPSPNTSSIVGAQAKSATDAAHTPDGAKNAQALPESSQRVYESGSSAASRTARDDSAIATMTSAQEDGSTGLHTLPRQDNPGGLPVMEHGKSGTGPTDGAAREGGGRGVQGGGGATASLLVRQNVLGAMMNLTRCSISHPKLEPSLVMTLLGMITQEYPSECPDEDTFGDLWVSWQAVILQLSFVERYRSLIVYHGDGQVFQHIKLTNDPLSGKSSGLSPLHDLAYNRLIMGTMVNIACEPLLFEELEWQVQFIREFLAEYEQEASGGGTSGGSRGGMSGRGIGGDFNHGGGCEDNVGDKGMGDIRGRSRGIGSGIGDGGDIRGGNNGIGVQNNLFSGRDLVRHELCGKLVSNLFSSKSLRERLSKKSIAGILVGLLCGPPTLRVTTSAQSNAPSLGTPTRSPKSRGHVTGDFSGASRPGHGTADDAKSSASTSTQRGPLPEGSEEPRPVLYGGGEETAAIASRFLCEICILYSAEGGFELPPRTFEGLVKIVQYYNYNPSASTASAIWPDKGGIGCASTTDSSNELPVHRQRKDCHQTTNVLGTWGEAPMASKSDSPLIDAQPTGISGGTVHNYNEDVKHSKDSDADSGISKSRSTKSGRSQFKSKNASPTRPRLRRESSKAGIEPQQIPGVPSSPQSSKKHHDGNDLHGDQGHHAPCLATARELMQLWVRAVGSLCKPSHSDLWPLMIDAGIFGALFKCVSSPIISSDNEGLLTCSASLRVLSTSIHPCSLRGDRAAACFGAAQRLQLCGSTQPEVRVNCTVAMVNFIDASQEQDLQNLDVVGLLSDMCVSYMNDSNDGSSHELARDLAVYGLSKLCARDFVPTGDCVVATITTMMDFDADTINRLDDMVKTPMAPPIPAAGPWRFLQPNKNLGVSALAMLDKRSRDTERACESVAGQGCLDQALEVGSSGDKDFSFWEGNARWKLRVTYFNEKMPEEPMVPVPEPAQSKKSQPTRCGQPGKQVSTEGAIGAGTISESPTTSNGQELSAGEYGHKVSGSTTETPASNSITDVAKTGVPGGAGKARGLDDKKKLRLSAWKVTASVIETSTASNFGSVSTGPVNIDTRILQNPLLTREDPPFELPWLLNHGEADRARLFRESMEGGWTSVNRVGASVFLAIKDAEKAMYEDGFHILTVPDDKWIGLDVPEARQRVLDLSSGVGSGSGQPHTLRARST